MHHIVHFIESRERVTLMLYISYERVDTHTPHMMSSQTAVSNGLCVLICMCTSLCVGTGGMGK